MNKTLLTLSASRLAELIRTGEITSREAVETHVQHAKTVNPELNAIVWDRFEQALADADRADRTLKEKGAENLPVFHGVPCTIKECFGFEGFRQTGGLVSRKDTIAQKDAPTVRRIRQAGGIPLGITNVPELCMWMETHNRIYGRTNNPYDPTRIVGGSSGGEGAIVGSGASPFGLGSDVGGSIRMPAFFNGVFGHKPSSLMIPNAGQFPIAAEEAQPFLTTGPLARRAEDLMPLLRILAGSDPEDAACKDRTLGDPAEVDVRKLRVINIEENGAVKVDPDLMAAQKRAAEHFASLGCEVRTVRIDKLKHSFDIWGAMLGAAGGPSFSSMMGGGEEIGVLKEMLKWSVRKSDHTLPALILAAIEPLNKLMPKRMQKFVEMGVALRAELTSLIGSDGILLFPSYSHPAPSHLRPLAMPFNWVYTAILNVMELPVTQTPLGLNAAGLPLGVQVVGIDGNDHVTIAAGLELERAFGGWVPPARYFSDWRPETAATAA